MCAKKISVGALLSIRGKLLGIFGIKMEVAMLSLDVSIFGRKPSNGSVFIIGTVFPGTKFNIIKLESLHDGKRRVMTQIKAALKASFDSENDHLLRVCFGVVAAAMVISVFAEPICWLLVTKVH